MTDETASLRAQIEEVIAWLAAESDRNLAAAEECMRQAEAAGPNMGDLEQEGDLYNERASCFAAMHSRLRAILPSPPLVIEPGRYVMRNGFSAWIVLEREGRWQGCREDYWQSSLIPTTWAKNGKMWNINKESPFDIIAPWEDADGN